MTDTGTCQSNIYNRVIQRFSIIGLENNYLGFLYISVVILKIFLRLIVGGYRISAFLPMSRVWCMNISACMVWITSKTCINTACDLHMHSINLWLKLQIQDDCQMTNCLIKYILRLINYKIIAGYSL